MTKRLQRAELVKGGAVAEKSFAISVLVGIVEVFVGIFSLSLALVADGVQSFADAVVSLIVWIGLRLSKKAPDSKFHFDYHVVETFSRVAAAFYMAVLDGIILCESSQNLLDPIEIVNAEIALAVAILASVIALSLLIFKTRGAKKYSSLALKADAFNSIKDVLTSVVASLGIVFNKYFHIAQTDSVAGIVIALFIFTVAYSVTKEASLVLMDACQCGEILSDIENIAKNVEHVREVHDIRMRKLGPYLIGDMHVVVDGDMSVREADQIATQIEERVKHEFDDVAEIKVRIEPREPTSKK